MQLLSAPVTAMRWTGCDSGMFALRERRIHVTQEDFEMAVSKVMKKDSEQNVSLKKLWK
jgi:26S proteasome regulatory subunit T6